MQDLIRKSEAISSISHIDISRLCDDKEDIIEQAMTAVMLTPVVEKLEPHPTEVIVLSFDYGETDLKQGKKLFDDIRMQFPNNKVICIPSYASLKSCSKDVLENIISMITEIIGEL